MIEITRLERAYETARQNLLAERVPDGHWIGQLSTSALSTATAVSALSAVQKATNDTAFQSLIDGGIDWLTANQNEDGGWGDTRKSYSNISTTLLAIACFHFAGREESLAEPIQRAESYVEKQGGIPGLRKRYGKDKTFAVPILANCAMAGTQDWKEVSTLPFEAACVPQKFYHLMQLPVVSYAIPALVAIGQAKYFFDPPWNPITRLLRAWSVGRSLKVLEKMQPASGGFLEAIPLTSFVVMGLASTGRADHKVVKLGVEFIRNSVLQDGSWPIDTNLATWTTTLSVNALSARQNNSPSQNGQEIQGDSNSPPPAGVDGLSEVGCVDWILSCQNRVVHPFTNSPPGGWGWTDLSGAVPDADDTPGALLALHHLYRSNHVSDDQKAQIRDAAELGVGWLLKLQNRDLGWPTFCRGWGKLPFDRSGSDLTAHCLRGINAWKSELKSSSRQIEKAIQGGLDYLEKNQLDDGSWLPLWFGNQDREDEENPVYGTSKVLAAFAELGKIETPCAVRGLNWLAENQNADGSWGGGPATAKVFGNCFADQEDFQTTGSVEETALALEGLLFSENLAKYEGILDKGLRWLIRVIEADCYRIDSPIGFYFAKLWYHERLYPQIFTVSALGRALARLTA